MSRLNQEALDNLRRIRNAESSAKLIGQSVAERIGSASGLTHRFNRITGDGTGTQIVAQADPRRLSMIVQAEGQDATIDLASPVSLGFGISLFFAVGPLIMTKTDWGVLVTMQWYGNLNLAGRLSVYEVLQL